MKRVLAWSLVLVALLCVPILSARAGHGASEMISGADSPADHEEIAEHFEMEALKARAAAREHRRMAEAYRKMGGPAVSKHHLDEHCDKIAASYEAAAKESEELAKAHRAMAGESKK